MNNQYIFYLVWKKISLTFNLYLDYILLICISDINDFNLSTRNYRVPVLMSKKYQLLEREKYLYIF